MSKQYLVGEEEIFEMSGETVIKTPFLDYKFPRHKKHISTLTTDEKMAWYSHQFRKNPGAYPVELTTKEFERFWKWKVLVPMKLKRLFFRIKNGEIFKHYRHISEIKKERWIQRI